MRTASVVLFLTYFTVFSLAGPGASAQNGKPFVLGVIEEIQSVELAEKRVLNIYLPAGYNPQDTARYPVIYLLDGSADEDFIHIVGLVQYNNFPWINRVPKSIVVGIANIDRKRDFTFPTTLEKDKASFPTTGHSDRFIAFIEKELQPFIEGRFRTTGDRMIIGESLGGLLATEILITKPWLFNRYIIVSPSLWWDNGSIMNRPSDIYSEGYRQRTGIYIGVGKEGLSPTEVPHVMEVDANVMAAKIKASKSSTVTVCFDYLPDENHASVTHQAVFNALRLLYPAMPEK